MSVSDRLTPARAGGGTQRTRNPRWAHEFFHGCPVGLQVARRKIDQKNLGGAAAIQRSIVGARIVRPDGGGSRERLAPSAELRESNYDREPLPHGVD